MDWPNETIASWYRQPNMPPISLADSNPRYDVHWVLPIMEILKLFSTHFWDFVVPVEGLQALRRPRTVGYIMARGSSEYGDTETIAYNFSQRRAARIGFKLPAYMEHVGYGEVRVRGRGLHFTSSMSHSRRSAQATRRRKFASRRFQYGTDDSYEPLQCHPM